MRCAYDPCFLQIICSWALKTSSISSSTQDAAQISIIEQEQRKFLCSALQGILVSCNTAAYAAFDTFELARHSLLLRTQSWTSIIGSGRSEESTYDREIYIIYMLWTQWTYHSGESKSFRVFRDLLTLLTHPKHSWNCLQLSKKRTLRIAGFERANEKSISIHQTDRSCRIYRNAFSFVMPCSVLSDMGQKEVRYHLNVFRAHLDGMDAVIRHFSHLCSE